MLPLSFTTGLFGFLLLVTPQLTSAAIIQGPTGVEYARRFAASPGLPGANCYYECPTLQTNTPSRNTPATLKGTTETSGITACQYGNGMNAITCKYTATGASAPGNIDACLPAKAFCQPPTRKRAETKLERVVRERQWKGPRKQKKA